MTLFVGKPGSGKTHVLKELLLNETMYYKKFDYVRIISPSDIEGVSTP